MITLLLTLAALGLVAWLLCYMVPMPPPMQRVIVGVAVLFGLLLVLSFFGVIRTPAQRLWSLWPVSTAHAEPVAVAISTPAPSLLSRPEVIGALIAFVAGALVTGLKWMQKLGADADRAREESELARIKAARERAQLEQEQAERSKDRAKEERAANKGTGAQAHDIAIKDFMARVPDATEEQARSAIMAAVGADPTIGASRVKTGGAS